MAGYNSSDAYMEWPFRVISSIFLVPLTFVGIVGNLMVILVVMTVRGMKTPTNCYLVSLACADCLFFLSSTPVELSSLHLPDNVFVFGRVGCCILRFLPFLSINASSMSITAFTIERYIGICHPMKARYICTVKRAQLIIVFIWTACVLYNSSWLFLTDLKPLNYSDWPGAYECTFSMDRASYRAVFLIDIFVFYWLPLLLYFVLYGSMARILVRAGTFKLQLRPASATPVQQVNGLGKTPESSRVRLDSLSSSDGVTRMEVSVATSRSPASCITVVTTGGGTTTTNNNSNNGNLDPLTFRPKRPSARRPVHLSAPSSASATPSPTSPTSATVTLGVGRSVTLKNSCEKELPLQESSVYYGKTSNRARLQVVKMLVVIVVIFALFWLPYRGLVVYNSFASKPWTEKWYLMFAKTMVMVNCAINPILYNLLSGKFRHAFRIMFTRCVRQRSSRRYYPAESSQISRSLASQRTRHQICHQTNQI